MTLDNKIKQRLSEKVISNNKLANDIVDDVITKLTNDEYEILGGYIKVKATVEYSPTTVYTDDISVQIGNNLKEKLGYNYNLIDFRYCFLLGLELVIERVEPL